MNSIGERIYELRKQNNMSQGDLADKLNVSRQTVSKWENNMSSPEIEKIVQLSDVFRVTIDYIIKGDKEENEPVRPIITEKVIIKEKFKSADSKKFFGIGLLLVSILLFFMMPVDFYYALFTAIIGLILVFSRKHGGLIAAWFAYLSISAYIFYGTGLSAFDLFKPFTYQHFNLSYFISFLLLVALIWLSVRTYNVIKIKVAEKT